MDGRTGGWVDEMKGMIGGWNGWIDVWVDVWMGGRIQFVVVGGWWLGHISVFSLSPNQAGY